MTLTTPAATVARSELALDRVGLEVELLAPSGLSRADVGSAIAADGGRPGTWVPVFAFGLEPWPGRADLVYHHLSRGVEVAEPGGRRLCRIVDDFSIREGLGGSLTDTGDYRIVSDDDRLLRLIERHTSPAAPIESALGPAADLFGNDVVTVERGVRYRLDTGGRTVAHAVLQTTGRERVCEVVTPVMASDDVGSLDRLLAPARTAGCMVPAEAAVHVHFDAEPYRDAGVFARTVKLFADHRRALYERFGTNPACRNLAPLPVDLVELVDSPGFGDLAWPEAERQLYGVTLLKNCDLNMLNLRSRPPGKDTVEVRILPGSLDTDRIMAQVDELRRLLLDSVF